MLRDWILPPWEGGPSRLSCCTIYLSAGVAEIGKIGRHVTFSTRKKIYTLMLPKAATLQPDYQHPEFRLSVHVAQPSQLA